MYFAVLQEEQFCMLSLRSDCFPSASFNRVSHTLTFAYYETR